MFASVLQQTQVISRRLQRSPGGALHLHTCSNKCKNVFMLFSTYSGAAQTEVGRGIGDERRGQIKTVFYIKKKFCLLARNKRNIKRWVAVENTTGFPGILGQTIHLTHCSSIFLGGSLLHWGFATQVGSSSRGHLEFRCSPAVSGHKVTPTAQ